MLSILNLAELQIVSLLVINVEVLIFLNFIDINK